MSKPRFSLYAEIDTLVHANQIKTSLQNELAGKDVFEEHHFNLVQIDSKNVLTAEWRFNKGPERDALRDWAKDQIQNDPVVKTWIQTAKLSWHLCSHDDAQIKDCRSTSYEEFIK